MKVTIALDPKLASRLYWYVRGGLLLDLGITAVDQVTADKLDDIRAVLRELTTPTPAEAIGLGSEHLTVLVKELVQNKAHFGHRSSRWNPKMEPYIVGKRDRMHIIDIRETLKGVIRAKKLVQNIVAQGKDVLFVGTKRQAQSAIQDEARRCGMHFVSHRWLGGMLTNFRTIRSRLNRLNDLDQLVTTGTIGLYSRKMRSTLEREHRKIDANLGGIRGMDRLPGLLVIVDSRREQNAANEARKLGVPTAAVIDTDSNPDLIDLPIPANDDSMKSIEIIMKELADSVIEGKAGRIKETNQRKNRSTSRDVDRVSSDSAAALKAPTDVASETITA